MTEPTVDRAIAERLLASRAAGDHFPDWMAGTIDLDQALQLQVAVLDDEVSRGMRVGGWKVGLTSEASRQKLGADERPFGFVRAPRVLESGTTVSSADVAGLSIESKGKFKSRFTKGGLITGRMNDTKKAVITLSDGDVIDFYSNI